MEKLIQALEEISKQGNSVIVKIDAERWADPLPKPYTVIVFGENFPPGESYRFDSEDFSTAVNSAISYFQK